MHAHKYTLTHTETHTHTLQYIHTHTNTQTDTHTVTDTHVHIYRVATPSRHLPGTFWNFTRDISGFTRDISRWREKFMNLPLFSHGKFKKILFHTLEAQKSCTNHAVKHKTNSQQ